MELSFGAIRIDDAVGHDGHSARPLVKAEVVSVGRRIRVTPLRRACLGIERIDNLLVANAMKQDDASLDDDGTAESLSDRHAPDDLRPLGRPGFRERGSAVHAGAIGTEELRPVLRRHSGGNGKRQERSRSDQASWHGTAANIPPPTRPACVDAALFGTLLTQCSAASIVRTITTTAIRPSGRTARAEGKRHTEPHTS